jgi:hypothetical protein
LQCIRQYQSDEAALLLCRVAADPAKAEVFLVSEIAGIWLVADFGVPLLRLFVLIFNDKKLKAMMPNFPAVVEFLASAMTSPVNQVFEVATAMFMVLPIDAAWGQRLENYRVVRMIMDRFEQLPRHELIAKAVKHIVEGYRSPVYEEFAVQLLRLVAAQAESTPHCLSLLLAMCEYREVAALLVEAKIANAVRPLVDRPDVGSLARSLLVHLNLV